MKPITQWCMPPRASDGGNRAFEAALYVLIILASAALFRNSGLMHPDWTYPYFSGAEHLDSLTGIKCSVEGYEKFRDLPTPEMFAYDFRGEQGHELKPCSFNDVGFVYVVYAAKHLFPFLSHINATVALQTLAHVVTTLIVAFSFRSLFLRGLFVLGYGANPIVLHLVTFAYSYYWQVIPSLFVIQLLRATDRRAAFFLLMYPLLFLSYLVRPSVLPLVALGTAYVIMMSAGRIRLVHAAAALALGAAILLAWQPKSPWHTMYVGIGAYDNDHMTGLADENGFLAYKKDKGIDVTSSVFDSTFYNASAREDYYQTMKKHYLDIVRGDYGLVLRNAAMNLAQSFSIGYLVKYPGFRGASMFLGVLILALLLYSRQYVLTLAILASSIGFVLYFPPIPAYMFGSYILLAYGVVRSLEILAARRDMRRVRGTSREEQASTERL